MTSPTDQLGRGVARFMLHVPSHLDPILYRTEFGGRDFLSSDISVVMLLSVRGSLSPTAIARALNMQKGSLSSVLKRLERRGVIARRRKTGDDRSFIIELTREGAALVAHMQAQRQRGLGALFAALPAEEASAAAQGLKLISDYLEKLEDETMADTHSNPLHWYYAASDEDRREYDAYGPWVVEVKSEADMPPRFRSFYEADKSANLLLKLPRREERRELRPGMDLYRAVIALREDGVTLREMLEGKVVSRDIGWDEIVAIRCRNDLLMGHWKLLLGDGTEIDQRFNRVSSDVMNQATDIVRAHLTTSDVLAGAEEPPVIEIPQSEVFFGSVLQEMTRRGPEPVVPLHFEPQKAPARGRGKSAATGVLMVRMPSELVIVSRDEDQRDPDEPAYASNDLFLPLNRITAFAMDAPGPNDKLPYPLLSLHLGRQLFRQSCRTAPDGVVAELTALGIPRVSDR
ncbi:MAG: MarR family transcriptional regulator [Maritimibacter sp.]